MALMDRMRMWRPDPEPVEPDTQGQGHIKKRMEYIEVLRNELMSVAGVGWFDVNSPGQVKDALRVNSTGQKYLESVAPDNIAVRLYLELRAALAVHNDAVRREQQMNSKDEVDSMSLTREQFDEFNEWKDSNPAPEEMYQGCRSGFDRDRVDLNRWMKSRERVSSEKEISAAGVYDRQERLFSIADRVNMIQGFNAPVNGSEGVCEDAQAILTRELSKLRNN